MAIPKREGTLLGIGPMSENLVKAIVQYSSETKTPIMLIASRRQVDASRLGGGYVNNWSTEEFSKYVKSLLAKTPAAVFLCRDHGGPWQGTGEEKLTYEEAKKRSDLSFETDIRSGFDLIHIDPSVNPTEEPLDLNTILERAFEILLHCESVAKDMGIDIEYEIGTEETSGKTDTPEEFEYFLKKIVDFCEKNKIKKPTFVVGQTGTLVKERHQAGTFDKENTRKLIEVCNKYGVGLKEHNGDYQTDVKLLKDRAEIGLHAMNIAPEFGVIETLTFIKYCKNIGMPEFAEEFLSLAHDSRKWEKWMISEHPPEETAVIAGHYVFAHPKFKLIRKKLPEEGAEADREIQKALRDRLDWYKKGLEKFSK